MRNIRGTRGIMNAFISYSTEDKEFAGVVKRSLESIEIESFLAHEDMIVSEEWKKRILLELKCTEVFVAVLTKHYKSSAWCDQELGFIVSRPDVLIIPLTIDGTIPYGFISHLQGQPVDDPDRVVDFILPVLYLKRPHIMIPLQIQKVRIAHRFRTAEATVRPLVEVFSEFNEQEIASFLDAVTNNSEVWDAGLCRSVFLPQFLKVNSARMTAEDRKRLEDVLE
jgi:hypothetical protein